MAKAKRDNKAPTKPAQQAAQQAQAVTPAEQLALAQAALQQAQQAAESAIAHAATVDGNTVSQVLHTLKDAQRAVQEAKKWSDVRNTSGPNKQVVEAMYLMTRDLVDGLGALAKRLDALEKRLGALEVLDSIEEILRLHLLPDE